MWPNCSAGTEQKLLTVAANHSRGARPDRMDNSPPIVQRVQKAKPYDRSRTEGTAANNFTHVEIVRDWVIVDFRIALVTEDNVAVLASC